MDTYIANISPMLQCPFVTTDVPAELELLLEENYFFYSGQEEGATYGHWNISHVINDKGHKRYYATTDFPSYVTLITGHLETYQEYADSMEELLKRIPLNIKSFVVVSTAKGHRTIEKEISENPTERENIVDELVKHHRDVSFLQA